MNILGLDQASNCGWCCGDNLYGYWDLTTRKDEDMGMKLIRFRSKLREVIESEKIDLIVYERVAGFHKAALIHAAKMVAIIELFCKDNNISYASLSATEIKKFATGKGNAKKSDMIKAAQEKYGYTGDNDNIADAIHIYQLAKLNFN